jgi:thiamine biosynthesis lipoprotein
LKFPSISQLVLFLAILLLNGCGHESLYQSQSYVFGTLVDISIYGEPEDRARTLAGDIEKVFQNMHYRFHAWKAGSELDALNQAFAEGRPYPVTGQLADMLDNAKQISARSGGLFNPAIGKLIQLWGFQRDEFTPVNPDPKQIAALVKANPQMSDIVMDHIDDGPNHSVIVSSKNPAVKLDLGGYAKGYALDFAAKILRDKHVQNALINIGGNIIAIGRHGDRPWRVGIQHPRQPGPIATLDLPDGWAIGTSGDYQRFFERDGQRYCHLIDPRSGYPMQGVEAVTILIPPDARAGARSDADSKPLFLSGVSGWRQAARTMGVEYALLIDTQGVIHMTQAMQSRIKLEDSHAKLDIVP